MKNVLDRAPIRTPEAVWNSYYGRICVYLRSFAALNYEDREEIAADTLYKVWQNRAKVLDGQDCRAWVFTIARRTAIDRLRKSSSHDVKKDGALSAELDMMPDLKNVKPEHQLIKNEELEFIQTFLKDLSDPDRELAYLFYYEELPIEELARIFSLPKGTIKWRLHAIRKKLARRWQDEFGI
ncbi:RNA polymerase sigma factor [Gracilinema caldarium]|uniref:RNA polymerase sigma factor n=1 Tax=Gracilinema caldarium TaxID=215591 RepID=UPI0026EB4B5F|nr:sigma-70 family RNA polymerase sigma factor [Gracilinema caldarium]